MAKMRPIEVRIAEKKRELEQLELQKKIADMRKRQQTLRNRR